jgi:signal transduction histidine kinase
MVERPDSGQGPWGEALKAQMSRLSAAVLAAAEAPGAPVEAPDAAAAERFPPRLVNALRRELITALASEPTKRVSSRELLAVLAAMDRMANDDERDAPLEFAARLANSEGLNGMVEIAHDMRSPLAAILLLVEPLRRGQHGPVTTVQERQLGLIYGAALSLSTLANDIIEAARGRCRAESARRPFSISGTMEAACAVVRPIAEEKQLALKLAYPSADGRIGDAAALHRILLNLTCNALKYTEQGSVSVGCTELDETRVEFAVTDTGSGIPPHIIDGLFAEHESNMRFTSTGLGLAICRTLTEHLGSRLQVETAKGKGTRFSFVLELPRAESDTTKP